jgi:hypothetical protein
MITTPKPAALFLLSAAFECLLALPASAQLSLFTVQGGVQTPVGESSDFGPVANGDSADVVFRLQYTGSAPTYYLNFFSVAGTGFSVAASDWQTLPAAFPASGYLDFTINFQPNNPGTQPENYSAILLTYGTQGVDNVQVYLLGTGTPGLTLLQNNQPSPRARCIAFGNVQVGSTGTVQLMLSNQTTAALTVPAIQPLTGAAFSVAGAAVSRPSVAPGSSAELDVVFTPTATGPQQATLTIGVLYVPAAGHRDRRHTARPAATIHPGESGDGGQRAAGEHCGEPGGGLSGQCQRNRDAGVYAGQTAERRPHGHLLRRNQLRFVHRCAGSFHGPVQRGALRIVWHRHHGRHAGLHRGARKQTAHDQRGHSRGVIGIDAAVAARDVSCAPSEVYCTTLT